jgi:hypothetical protein
MTVALLFVSVGVSFAHDLKDNRHQPPGKAYGHYPKRYNYHQGWKIKHHPPKYYHHDRYRYHRSAPRKRAFFGVKIHEPVYKFVVVVKDRR